MWTNVFRIGGLQQVSWFQLLPAESDSSALTDKSAKIEEQKDAATFLVLSAHIRLQNEGFLSTWTNSFVGPWDPSQGIYNPDEKIKLWLFLPGRHTSINPTAQAALCGLKVVGSGLWSAPGDSEEVAVALSQALRNCIERAFRGLAYVRFGDVFVKCRSFGHNEMHFRKPLSTCEFIFSASEEAIFIHVVVSGKRIRALSSDDMEGVLRKQSYSTTIEDKLAVVVAPHGMTGRLTGCCPSDLVRQLYQSKMKASNDISGSSLPFHASQSSYGKIRGQTCYAEVSLGCLAGRAGKASQISSNLNRNGIGQDDADMISTDVLTKDERKQGCLEYVQIVERTFIYPVEAVLVPMMPVVLARTCLRRCWLQDWAGTSWLENGQLADLSSVSSSISGSIFGITDGKESLESSWIDSNGMHPQNSSNSNSSSSSSGSSSSRGSVSSGDSDGEPGIGSGELEADADSLASKQSHLTSAEQVELDESKILQGGKRGRSNGTELLSQAAASKSARMGNTTGLEVPGLPGERIANDTIKSGANLTELNAVGVSSTASGVARNHWDWPDGMGMDIQTVLAEFGDFGDFFEDDALGFGEPPGTAESEALLFSLAGCGDGAGSPGGRGMDTSDQMLLPVVDFSTLDGFNQHPALGKEEALSGNKESSKDARSSQAGSHSSGISTVEVDSLPKAEAMMMFAPEYTAIETPGSENSSSIFRSPYIPESRKMQNSQSSSNVYVYSATPPPSPSLEICDQKSESPGKKNGNCKGKDETDIELELKKHYRHVQAGKQVYEKPFPPCANCTVAQKGESSLMTVSGLAATKIGMSVKSKKAENGLGAGGFLIMPKTVLATEIECAMLQAAMCRIRHMLLSCGNIVRLGSNKLTVGTLLDQFTSPSQFHESSMLSGKLSAKQEQKKKDCIPVRIAGDVDEEMHDGLCTAQVRVWRPVGMPKPSKSSSVLANDSVRSAPYNTSEEESVLSNGQKQPLHELLDAMPFLVQQAAASMDISLDGDCGDGPFGWLAYQEQQRRRFSCGPSMIHAACGGFLATCHFLDGSGVELMDHLAADVSAASVLSLLQSDIRMALKTAFGDTNLDGPLSIADWCRGRVQLADVGPTIESYSSECTPNDSKETTGTVTVAIGEPITPPQCSAGGSVSLKGTPLQHMDNQMSEVQRGNKNWSVETLSMSDGARLDDGSQKRTTQESYNSETEMQMNLSRNRPTLVALPVPALLVGYQDDWLKTSSRTLQLWEKAPLEPYALPKPVTYYVVCPNSDQLLTASADFFQQLGTVYEACKLGTHVPMNIGGQIGFSSGKWASSGVVPIDCPAQFRKASYNLSFIGSVNDYLMALGKGWDISSFRKSLSKTLKTLQIATCPLMNQKDSENGSCTVIYIICPFAEPAAVLQTTVEACNTLGSIITPADKERRLFTYSQVGKALNYAATLDETQNLSVPVLFGFSIPKLVLQVLTAEAILKVSRPPVTELATLKETAFTVYNKARRIPRWTPVCDSFPQATPSLRVRSGTVHMGATVPGLWKDCGISRSTAGTPALSRDNALELGCLRPNAWDNPWQTRHGESNTSDSSGPGDSLFQDDVRYLFEPLFILAEPGSLDQGVSLLATATAASDSLRTVTDDASGSAQPPTSSGPTDVGLNLTAEGSESDCSAAGNQKAASLHCCYGWTEDWQWVVCVWTDGRGELLDVHIFPFGGISGRQDTKGLQSLFIQVLQQGCQILSSTADAGGGKPRNIVIARIGCFYELECQEWQKAIFAVGGNEVKKWPLQLRRCTPDGSSTGGSGSSLQQQEINLIQERILPPSPSPSSSLFGSHPKSSSFIKGSLVQTNNRKPILPGHSQGEVSKGPFQWVQSISLVGLCIDHSLQLVCPAEMAPLGGTQGVSVSMSTLVESLSPVKSLGSTSVSNLFVPSHGLRFFPPMPLQLPNCLTSESPPLAHLLHSKGFAFPFATGFVVSRATPSIRRDFMQRLTKEEWPSTLMVNLVDYYGAAGAVPIAQQGSMPSDTVGKGKQSRIPISESKDCQTEAHQILERIAAELHALSWLTVSPTFLERRTALPLHSDMVQRLRRLLHYAAGDFGLPGPQEKS